MTFASRLLTCALLLFVPALVSAATTTTWDFRNANLPGKWTGERLDPPQVTAEGFAIDTNQPGSLVSTLNLTHPIDVVEFTYTSQNGGAIALVWQSKTSGELVRHVLTVPPSEEPFTMAFNPSRYPNEWDPTTPRIGFGFDGPTQITLQDLRFVRYSWNEKLTEAWRSFWTYDDFRGYSVNFLWGPLLAFTPIGRFEMFLHIPAIGRSANWVFFGMFGLVALICLLLRAGKLFTKRQTCLTCLTVLGSLWLLYDVRMGSEFISYLADDIRMYWSQSIGQRTFRVRDDFNDFAKQVAPLLREDDDYVLITSNPYPFKSILRYETFPSLPVRSMNAHDNIRRWVVYERPDVQIDEQNRLTEGDVVLTRPGEVIYEYSADSYVFHTP